MEVDPSDVNEFLAEHGEDVTLYDAPTQVLDTSSLAYGSIKTNTEATGATVKAFIIPITIQEIQESDGKWSHKDCKAVFANGSGIANGVKIERLNNDLYIVDSFLESSHNIHHYEVILKYLRNTG